jgi:hypothetical protein
MQDKWNIDLYSDGACVYEVNHAGDVTRVVGWSQNQGAAMAIFEYLCREYPRGGYAVRLGARVMGKRMPS